MVCAVKLKAALPEIIAFAAANKTLPKRAKKITYTTPEADVVDDCMTGLQELCRKIGIRVMFVLRFLPVAILEQVPRTSFLLQRIAVTD